MMKRLASWSDTYLYGFMLALVLVMPLHAFIVVSLGHLVGHQSLWQVWKEAGLVAATLAAGLIVLSDAQKRRYVLLQPTFWLVVSFTLYALAVSAIYQPVSLYHFLLGAKTTLGFLILFVVMQATRFSPARWQSLLKALLGISTAIGIFTIAQVYFLPADFLTRFGYGASTIPPFHLVDPALSTIRVIATLSGPNQLGSFMIIPLVLSFWLVLRKRWIAILPLLLSAFALWHSYSRSAWIGAAAGLFVVLIFRLKGAWRLVPLVIFALALISAQQIRTQTSGRTGNLRYYVYHGEIVDGKPNGSDQQRLSSAERGVLEIKQQPQGHGLGTAGPASQNTAVAIITENTYLQIGIEAGIPGLLVFIAIVVAVIVGLLRRQPLIDEAPALAAILIGLSLTNLFLHTWSDSATALVFWGLAGYAFALNPKARHE